MGIFIFILGLVFGSFYNVCIYRLPNKESISFPPSSCGSCNKELKPLDLIPVLSYFYLKGKCRYCGKKVSIQYPIIELITGFIFIGMYYKYGLSLFFLKSIILASIVLVVSVIDFKHYIIPDKISLFTFLTSILFALVIRDLSIKSLVLAFLLGGGFLFLIAIVGPMGGGDIKIMAGYAIYLGFQKTVLALLLSFILGGLIGILLIGLRIKKRKDHIPFGPFLGLGSLISFLYFNEILNWYINTL